MNYDTATWNHIRHEAIAYTATKVIDTNAQNFHLLKIHLNLVEIWNRVLKFENLIQIWKSFIPSQNLFQTRTMQSGAMCVYSSVSRDKVKYYTTLQGPSLKYIFTCDNRFFRFILNFQISKLNLRFQINYNGFSRHTFSIWDFLTHFWTKKFTLKIEIRGTVIKNFKVLPWIFMTS